MSINSSLTRRIAAALCAAGLWISSPALLSVGQVTAPGGSIHASRNGDQFRLENPSIGARWSIAGNALHDLVVEDRLHGTELPVPSAFSLSFKDGRVLRASDLKLTGEPRERALIPQPTASRQASRLTGRQVDIPLESQDHSLRATWSMVLLGGSNYLREILHLEAVGSDASISRVEIVDVALAAAQVAGSVAGSPIVAGNMFLGFEHPLARCRVTDGRAEAWMDRQLPLRAGQSIEYSAVFGVARAGQMRRDFLAYLERERAHPYRTFLHYNSWYDLGYGNSYDRAGALDRIHRFGHELTEKRGVKLDSFLFDDGWDNRRSLWKFNDAFPDGFMTINQAAEKYGAEPGIWMSPWGGYAQAKKERIAFGKNAGYEIVAGGYALSGPRYYTAFRDVCLELIRKYGVNQFKFDGTGNVNSVVPGSDFDSDFSAAIHLIGELRAAKPAVYVNLTTGTWPSPFWLIYADSIWRGGEDDSVAGVGSYREQWITYRDEQTYQNIVKHGPLFPLSSLMLHGMIYAERHPHLNRDPGNDLRNEIRSYFGTGTQLQEMYITPSLLTETNWDDVAEAAKWSRANADVSIDTHWIGGDPARLEVYGWASWTPRKGILVLRNPADKEQTIFIKLQDAFELPPEAAQIYSAKSPWKDNADVPALRIEAQKQLPFRLAPFEVLTLDIVPSHDAGR